MMWQVICWAQYEVSTLPTLHHHHYPGLHGGHGARWRPCLDSEWRPEIQWPHGPGWICQWPFIAFVRRQYLYTERDVSLNRTEWLVISIHHWYITSCRYIVPINVSVQIPYQERYYAFCWSVRSQFRCSRYRIQMKNEIRTEYKEKQRLVTECCEGYTRSLNGSTCIPVCSDACIHGYCVRPDTCQCERGFGGQDCSKCKKIFLWNFVLKDLTFSLWTWPLGTKLQP